MRKQSPVAIGSRVEIASHSDLIKAAVRIRAMLEEDRRFQMLFLVDPVLAMKEAGFLLSRPMTKHIHKSFHKITSSKKEKTCIITRLIQYLRRRLLFFRIKTGRSDLRFLVGVSLKAHTRNGQAIAPQSTVERN